MKIIVIGANGTLGKAVVKELSKRHEIIRVGKKSGDIICDITSESQIRSMYKQVGNFDAVAVTAGDVHFEEMAQMTPEKYAVGLQSKLMGQVNLVLIGTQMIQSGGSFTLISGVLSRDPIKSGSSASMVNGAVNAFIKAAAIELPRQIRINVVSPTIVVESMDVYGSDFRGFEPVPVSRVGLAFSKSVEGFQTGQVYEVV